jgi:hypothetical protein
MKSLYTVGTKPVVRVSVIVQSKKERIRANQREAKDMSYLYYPFSGVVDLCEGTNKLHVVCAKYPCISLRDPQIPCNSSSHLC